MRRVYRLFIPWWYSGRRMWNPLFKTLALGALWVLAACSEPPELQSSNSGNYALVSFRATPNPATPGSKVAFSWKLEGSGITCKLDINKDGRFDYTLKNCNSSTTQNHKFDKVGNYEVKLRLEKSGKPAIEQTLTLTVAPPNTPPKVATPTVVPGATPVQGVLSFTVSDPENDPVGCKVTIVRAKSHDDDDDDDSDHNGDDEDEKRKKSSSGQQPLSGSGSSNDGDDEDDSDHDDGDDEDKEITYIVENCQSNGTNQLPLTLTVDGSYQATIEVVQQTGSSKTASQTITFDAPFVPLARQFNNNLPNACRGPVSPVLGFRANSYVTHFVVDVSPALEGFPQELPATATSITVPLPANSTYSPQNYTLTLTAHSTEQSTAYSAQVALYGQNTVCNLLDELPTAPQGSLRQTMADVPDEVTVIFWPALKGTIALQAPLELDRPLTVVGPGASTISISGQDAHPVLLVSPNGQGTFSGLTLTRGTGESGGLVRVMGQFSLLQGVLSNGQANQGGAIYNEGVAVLEDVQVTNTNASQQGGAIYNLGLAMLTNTTLRQTQASSEGGAIYNPGLLSLTGVGFQDSRAALGGAIHSQGLLEATSTRFEQVEAQAGGALYLVGGTSLLSQAVFTAPKATAGSGGAILVEGGSLTLEDSQVTQAQSSQSGGAIAAQSSQVVLRRSSLSGSSAATTGGALEISGSLELEDSILSNNRAGSHGGAVHANNASLSLTRSTLTGNFAAQNGGAVWLREATLSLLSGSLLGGVQQGNRANGYGGAVYADTGTVIYLDPDTGISHNQANTDNLNGENGGGLSLASDSVVSGNTGVIANNLPDNQTIR